MRRLGGLAVTSLLLVGGIVPSAEGATFTPTRFDDPPPNRCKPENCSLREAILAANNRQGRDTITLGDGTYELELLPAAGGGNLFTGDPLTMRGLGPKQSKIDANGLDRVLTMASPVGQSKIQGLTIKGGDAGADPGQSNEGGGLLTTDNKVTLDSVVVKLNTAQFGGGISAEGVNLTIKDSTIARNIGQEGGAIDLRAGAEQPLVSIRSSTIWGNTAINGAGVMVDGTSGVGQIPPILQVDNSTVASNNAITSAGGIAGGQEAIVVLDNTTVAYNFADADHTGGGVAGGIFQGNDASFQLNDSLLAANGVGSSGSGPACHGEFEDGGSLVDATGSNPNCDFVGLFQPDTTTTPMIGGLEDNGGPTRTIRLLGGSPAIGIALDCPNRDQRGRDRPDEDCDAGSYERKGL
jgi:CSLREA domain-containing protein